MITDMSRDYNKCNNEWNLKDITCILTQNNMEYQSNSTYRYKVQRITMQKTPLTQFL
jgi:hypothetical protein